MKKLLTLLFVLSVLVTVALLASLVGCSPKNAVQSTTQTTYTPSLSVDSSQGCTSGGAPTVADGTVTFGAGTQCQAGRVISNSSYKNITQVTATIDLSKINSRYVNASFYMVSNPTNPGQKPVGNNYCDAGGTNGHDSWNCQEIDFLETNGNRIFQSTLHLGNGGSSAPQRYQYAFTNGMSTDACYVTTNMQAIPNQATDLTSTVDISKPFDMTTDFAYGSIPSMKITVSQSGKSQVIYDTTAGSGAPGSGTIDMANLATSMANGYWLAISFWQGYSPLGINNSWYNNANPPCPWGNLCNNNGSYWSISNIRVIAD